MHDVSDMDARNARSNYDVKEQIREYWSRRSQTFDQSPAHGIHSQNELESWQRLIGDNAQGIGNGRVLELASGTGEFTRVLRALGCQVEGLDISEAMIRNAREKHGGDVKFHLGDAENTMLPDGLFDAVVCRHLVWTLLDPENAFGDWLRILKPGGRLIIIDGNWQHQAYAAKLAAQVARIWDRFAPRKPLYDAEAHRLIQAQLFFRDGLSTTLLIEMLGKAGFAQVHSGPLKGVLASQLRAANWRDRLDLLQSQGRSFIVSAQRPSEI
ncbi:class I SAM-dependent methyltransferase [Aureimonas fodinaquatilis]|uniref:Class I SAM-dependent methyltransferase n=1 Tax=Aureimonas fodinaquatilis TaxID=2565783 RepID=A0A5B0DSB6_9HYPH|nr:class I SAM-dependent methyltransferase [Aureimonas fodinaquatilis]KAA0968892.1 class I SAM-dependent methyltransferase [Aureimonas fodinaquatilis]